MPTKPTKFDAKSLPRQLTRQKARWEAGETEVGKLDEKARRRLLGAVPSAESRAFVKAVKRAAPMLAAAPGFAPEVDWRNRNGNHITAVRSQGGCGSCVSFSSVGLIEAMAHIETGRWIDLSEADSHFCSAHGANCTGWWPDQCLDQVIARGVCDDAGFPYASAFPNGDIWSGPPQCVVAPDRAQRLVSVTARHALPDAVAAKNHLSNVGPVTGCLTVYTDLFHYVSGVYSHVSGGVEGGHCVLVIGYSEAEQCWIIKNSWGPTWGMGGFGKVAYADLVFEGGFFPMYGATGVRLPVSGWQPLGGALTSEPVAGSNADGRIEVFARGADGALWHVWQTAPNGGWSGWASLGGTVVGTPAVVGNADGRLEAFARGADGALWHIWQTAPNGGWSGWASLGGAISGDPCAVRNADGRLEAFARGTDGALWHITQQGAQQGWSGWASLGVQFVGSPVAGSNADGRVEVFMRANNGALLHARQSVPGGGWGNWVSLGGAIMSDPAVANHADGRLAVFARGADNALRCISQRRPNGNWTTWTSLGGASTGNPTVGRNADGRLQVFVRGTDGAPWHNVQSAPGGAWTGWASLGGGVTGDTAAAAHQDGRLALFACGIDNALWQRWQTAPGGGWN